MARSRFLGALTVWVAAAACLLSACDALAQAPAGTVGVDWRCAQEYDEDFNVVCVPIPVRDTAAARSAQGAAPAASAAATFRGRDLRPVAARGMDAVFAADEWRVPLFHLSADRASLVRLLQAVLCDAAPDCTVDYRSGRTAAMY